MKSAKRNPDNWVLGLTALFVIVAVAVFAFAINRHRKAFNSEGPIMPVTKSSERETHAREFRVVRVVDGDTLTVIGADKINLSIRLRGIDAPELGQGHGFEAKEALGELIESGIVRLETLGKDKYGRYLANVFVNDLCINKALVMSGHAWCEQSHGFNSDLSATERSAKEQKIGLWSAPDPIAPWIWRSQGR